MLPPAGHRHRRLLLARGPGRHRRRLGRRLRLLRRAKKAANRATTKVRIGSVVVGGGVIVRGRRQGLGLDGGEGAVGEPAPGEGVAERAEDHHVVGVVGAERERLAPLVRHQAPEARAAAVHRPRRRRAHAHGRRRGLVQEVMPDGVQRCRLARRVEQQHLCVCAALPSRDVVVWTFQGDFKGFDSEKFCFGRRLGTAEVYIAETGRRGGAGSQFVVALLDHLP